MISRLLALPLVKALKFALSVTLRIGSSNSNKLKVDKNCGPLPPAYSLYDGTLFRNKLKESHTKAVKYYDAEVKTGIWYDATATI